MPIKGGKRQKALHGQLEIEFQLGGMLARLGRAAKDARRGGGVGALGAHVDAQFLVEEPEDFLRDFLDRVARLFAGFAHAVQKNVALVAVVD